MKTTLYTSFAALTLFTLTISPAPVKAFAAPTALEIRKPQEPTMSTQKYFALLAVAAVAAAIGLAAFSATPTRSEKGSVCDRSQGQ